MGEDIKTSGKILGIDYGTKNIGLAISDSEQRQAFVYGTLKLSLKFWEELKEICEKEKIDKVVVGLPIGLNGEYTQKTIEVINFTHLLAERTKLIVETEDERLSTIEGQKFSAGHSRDESAARVILQSYLDRKDNQ